MPEIPPNPEPPVNWEEYMERAHYEEQTDEMILRDCYRCGEPHGHIYCPTCHRRDKR